MVIAIHTCVEPIGVIIDPWVDLPIPGVAVARTRAVSVPIPVLGGQIPIVVIAVPHARALSVPISIRWRQPRVIVVTVSGTGREAIPVLIQRIAARVRVVAVTCARPEAVGISVHLSRQQSVAVIVHSIAQLGSSGIGVWIRVITIAAQMSVAVVVWTAAIIGVQVVDKRVAVVVHRIGTDFARTGIH